MRCEGCGRTISANTPAFPRTIKTAVFKDSWFHWLLNPHKQLHNIPLIARSRRFSRVWLCGDCAGAFDAQTGERRKATALLVALPIGLVIVMLVVRAIESTLHPSGGDLSLPPTFTPAAIGPTEGPATLAPSAMPTPGMIAVPSPVSDIKLLATNDLYAILRDTDVTSECNGGALIATVHRGKYVQVIANGRDCYEIRLRSGLTGFVPSANFQFVRALP
jgi:hypothetical protein